VNVRETYVRIRRIPHYIPTRPFVPKLKKSIRSLFVSHVRINGSSSMKTIVEIELFFLLLGMLLVSIGFFLGVLPEKLIPKKFNKKFPYLPTTLIHSGSWSLGIWITMVLLMKLITWLFL
jgi:hypothetical protein